MRGWNTMTFPYYIHLFGFQIHPHLLFEVLAYFIAARIYFRLSKTSKYTTFEKMTLLTYLIAGAFLGSKIVSLLENPRLLLQGDYLHALEGKTVVGGFLGGWIGIELAKKQVGIKESTGDAFVIPMAVGLIIGRVGCFLTGLSDDTVGTPTSLPWGVDFGDGVLRHPAQLYEIGFLVIFTIILYLLRKKEEPNGLLFRKWMGGYLFFRFFVDFIKPVEHFYFGLNSIQIACLTGLGIICIQYKRWAGVRQ